MIALTLITILTTAPVQAEAPPEVESPVERALAEGLTPEIVAKLDGEQLAKVLRERERSRAAPDWEEIVVPTVIFGSIAFMVALALWLRSRQHEQRQQTLRLMVEKGTPIPAELLPGLQQRRSDLRRGVLAISGGLGLAAFLSLINTEQPGVWSLGLIPTLIGAGYLLVWRLEHRNNA